MLLGHLDKSTIITGSDGKCPHVDSGAIMIDLGGGGGGVTQKNPIPVWPFLG